MSNSWQEILYQEAQQKSELLLHEAEAEKATARATAYGQIVSGTAHDMRTPVSVLLVGFMATDRCYAGVGYSVRVPSAECSTRAVSLQ